MSEQRALLLRNGLIASCALLALVLLASFYSIVSGAVERAARQRLAAGAGRTTPSVATAQQSGAPGAPLFARIGN
jgi:hypothetical protein